MNLTNLIRKKGKIFLVDLYVDLRYKTRLAVGNIEFPSSPMIDKETLNFLEENLNKKNRILEYGSGASTLFIAKRVLRIVTVENQWLFSRALNKELKKSGILNCDLKRPKTGLTGQGCPNVW